MKRKLIWIPVTVIAVIYLQALFFKLSGSEETSIIFDTVGTWMHTTLNVPQSFSDVFSQYGAYVVGSLELIIVILMLVPKTRIFGAFSNIGIISGALFVHLYTPVGINRVVDSAGNTDGGALFIMACLVALSTLWILIFSQTQKIRSQPYATEPRVA